MKITLKNLQKKIPVPKAKILKTAKAALRKLKNGAPKGARHPKLVPGTFSIVFVGAKRMRAINKKFMGHDYVTDVLTFNLGSQTGEIIICPQAAFANARIYQTSTENEIILYVVHGILHLAGFEDKSPQGMLQMRKMEKELL